LKDRFKSCDYIGDVCCPCLLIAGDRDNTIPISMSRALFAGWTGAFAEFAVRDCGHRGLLKRSDVHRAMAEFLGAPAVSSALVVGDSSGVGRQIGCSGAQGPTSTLRGPRHRVGRRCPCRCDWPTCAPVLLPARRLFHRHWFARKWPLVTTGPRSIRGRGTSAASRCMHSSGPRPVMLHESPASLETAPGGGPRLPSFPQMAPTRKRRRAVRLLTSCLGLGRLARRRWF
jgi:hypothetical protein